MSRGPPSRLRAAVPWAEGGAFVFGLGFTILHQSPCSPDMARSQCAEESSRADRRYAAGGAVLGAVLGGAFGVLFRRGERWQAASLPVRFALTPPSQHSPTAGLAVAVSWR